MPARTGQRCRADGDWRNSRQSGGCNAGCDAVGVNAGNYRSAALSGGNDVQLKTMCGQAFEYYAMYKRALGQGYSEADANRTYDAHEKSALVANDFYANNH